MGIYSKKGYTRLMLLVRLVIMVYCIYEILTTPEKGLPSFLPVQKDLLAFDFFIYSIAAGFLYYFINGRYKDYFFVSLDTILAALLLAQMGTPKFCILFALPVLESAAVGLNSSAVFTFLSFLLFAAIEQMVSLDPGQTVLKNQFMFSGELPFCTVFFLLIFLAGHIYDLLKWQERQTEALYSLLSASQELGSATSMEKVLSQLITMISGIFNATTIVVYLKDDENPGEPLLLRVKAFATNDPQSFSDFNPAAVKSLVGQAFKDKKGILLNDYYGGREEDIVPRNKAFRSVMIVPLVFEEESLGVIYAAYSRPAFFSESNVHFLTMIARQVAVAVRNVQLHTTTQALAITDSLSGMYTHGYFQDHLGKEITRSKYANQPISIVIIDVDFFKKVNDSYGHPQGDSILRQLGGVIRRALRPTDVICRYGGDEFTVTMSNSNRIGAVMLAERVRQAVEDYEFVLGNHIVHITVSGGVAAFPEDAETKKDLVDKADKALYEAKRKGRNKVCYGVE
ncbi:MAG: sensor domain-containing diguanylate cyclase [bacterium]